MRVAIVTPEFLPNWGGIGTYVTLLGKELPDEVEVHVITLRRGTASEMGAEAKEILNRIQVHYVGNAEDFFLYNSQLQMDLLLKFKALKSQYKFDLLHANHAQMPDLFLRFMDASTPNITTIHTTIDSQRMGTRRSKMPISHLERSEKMTLLMLPALRTIERLYLGKSRHVIFVSEFIKRLYSKRYRLPKDWRIIHNGVDTEMFKPRSRSECIEKFPMLDGLEDIILFSGRMIALKGIDVAIKNFALIHDETDATMVFAGAGKIEPWKTRLDQLGVPNDRYIFLGGVPYLDMPYLYSLATVFTLPSYSESFPMTILEAMACELPVIATDVGGIPEMIDSNRNGLLYEPSNPKGLSTSLLKILGDRKFASMLAKNARAKVCHELSATKMASSTSEMYIRTLEGRE